MKLIQSSIYIALILICVSLNSDSKDESEQPAKISFEIKVTNIKETEGTIRIGIYVDPQAWKDSKPDHKLEARPSLQESSAVIDLPPGDYAASVYHDVNDDSEINRKKGGFRMPTEPYGFSNDARPRFGLPGWKRVKFTIAEDSTEHTISLVHP